MYKKICKKCGKETMLRYKPKYNRVSNLCQKCSTMIAQGKQKGQKKDTGKTKEEARKWLEFVRYVTGGLYL